MIRVTYQTRRGGSVIRYLPQSDVPDMIERLHRQRLAATAKDDDGKIVGESYRGDPQVSEDTGRIYRWTWWADADRDS